MPFTALKLHPSLLRGLKELGFARPTPIQADAIPPGLEGRDVLACAATGSGKTAAFLLPILQRLIDKPRGTTRALVLAPTRELAAQILEHLNELSVHTPITGASVFGGVGMGPQEHAFRSGVDVIIATPGRLLDHLRSPYVKFGGLEVLVLDEADRMLDMGFLPEIRKILKHLPAKRQTLFFSATMPAPIVTLSGEMLRNAVTIAIERKSAPAVGITQAVYPVSQELKSALLVALLARGDMKEALVFTRTKHRANRLAEHLIRAGINADRIHGNRSQSQRTAALAAFKSGRTRVLVATDIAARGIDVEALGHVVNFDVPMVPDDYIHRVGRTARAEATGEAFTFVSPQEESDLRAIESAISKRLPRVTVPDFDYTARPQQKLEIPLAERIAAIRKMKSEQRARSAMKNARTHGPKAGSAHGARPAPSGGPKSRVARAGPGTAAWPGRSGWPADAGVVRAAAAGRGEAGGTSDDRRHTRAARLSLLGSRPPAGGCSSRSPTSSARATWAAASGPSTTRSFIFAAEWAWHSRWHGVSPTALEPGGRVSRLRDDSRAVGRARAAGARVRRRCRRRGPRPRLRLQVAGRRRRPLAALADGAARREPRQLPSRPGHHHAAAGRGRAGQEPRPDRLLPRTGVTIRRSAGRVRAVVLRGLRHAVRLPHRDAARADRAPRPLLRRRRRPGRHGSRRTGRRHRPRRRWPCPTASADRTCG